MENRLNEKQIAAIANMTEKQLASMKNNKQFMSFLRIAVNTKGNLSTKQFEEANLPFELFLRFMNTNSVKLYNTAKALLEKLEAVQ